MLPELFWLEPFPPSDSAANPEAGKPLPSVGWRTQRLGSHPPAVAAQRADSTEEALVPGRGHGLRLGARVQTEHCPGPLGSRQPGAHPGGTWKGGQAGGCQGAPGGTQAEASERGCLQKLPWTGLKAGTAGSGGPGRAARARPKPGAGRARLRYKEKEGRRPWRKQGDVLVWQEGRTSSATAAAAKAQDPKVCWQHSLVG